VLVLDVFLEVVLPVLVIAAVGGAVGRRLGVDVGHLSTATFNLFSPALSFTTMSTLDMPGGDVGRIAGVTAAVFAVNAVVGRLWSTLRRADPETRACIDLTGVAVNHGNLGLPMAALAFGAEGLEVAIVVFVTGVLLWSSLGVAFASSGRVPPRDALLAPLRYPILWGAVLGGLVNVTDLRLPVALEESTRILGEASIPVMLVVLGLQFRPPRRGALLDPLVTSANRLLVGPAVAWPLAAAFGLTGVAADQVVLAAGLPTAVITTIVATEMRVRPELAVQTVVLSTLLAVPSLTILLALLR
jgi:malate permease and related proteins